MDESTSIEARMRARFLAAGIDPRGVDELRELCESEGLDGDTWALLALSVPALASLEKWEAPRLPTNRARIEALEQVRKAATALDDAIRRVEHESDSRKLEHALRGAEVPLLTGPAYLYERPHLSALRSTAYKTGTAVAGVLSALNAEGVTRRGARRTLDFDAERIAEIAYLLMPYGVVPGAGEMQKFRRICDLVFSIAGHKRTAEGAIKRFLSTLRPALQAKGECL